eukprot:CAMPEP_0168486470 /NCGR_PEP_ID=MMETSP0228-20121227/67135_1 /TAXON_ID=133427 /ORGANISM="Protoceratium reticulatum, Strain CCCM 535 (=CCMP 1889)" /LENGTH=219 /DNA_ID=CAMNT_0008503053 /DNA_START=278 /DNA_END=934 /DNA_ORIENTATION=+
MVANHARYLFEKAPADHVEGQPSHSLSCPPVDVVVVFPTVIANPLHGLPARLHAEGALVQLDEVPALRRFLKQGRHQLAEVARVPADMVFEAGRKAVALRDDHGLNAPAERPHPADEVRQAAAHVVAVVVPAAGAPAADVDLRVLQFRALHHGQPEAPDEVVAAAARPEGGVHALHAPHGAPPLPHEAVELVHHAARPLHVPPRLRHVDVGDLREGAGR